MENYKIAVHRSLIKRKLTFGLTDAGLLTLFLTGLIIIFIFRQIWFIGMLVVLYLIMRRIIKKDSFGLEILLSFLTQPDQFD